MCVYVCPAMHFAMLRRIELKLGMGVGDGPTRFVGCIFEGTPPWVKGHPGVNLP